MFLKSEWERNDVGDNHKCIHKLRSHLPPTANSQLEEENDVVEWPALKQAQKHCLSKLCSWLYQTQSSLFSFSMPGYT